MGIWPGTEYYRRRYEYPEYVNIMCKPWAIGPSDYWDDFFPMDNCRDLPRPMAEIPIICAAQSDAGAAQHADYNFCGGGQVNQPPRKGASSG